MDGKITIGGDIAQANGQNRSRMARLNAEGTLVTSFQPGLGPNNSVYDIELQADGKIVIGGAFTQVNGFDRAGVARLNTDVTETPAPIAITGAVQSASDLLVTFASQNGVTYELQGTSDFVTWTPVGSKTANSASTTISVPITAAGYQFFRVHRTSP